MFFQNYIKINMKYNFFILNSMILLSRCLNYTMFVNEIDCFTMSNEETDSIFDNIGLIIYLK